MWVGEENRGETREEDGYAHWLAFSDSVVWSTMKRIFAVGRARLADWKNGQRPPLSQPILCLLKRCLTTT